MSEHSDLKGGVTLPRVNSSVRHIDLPSGNIWSCVQNNNNNANYTNFPSGSTNNNNKNNSNYVVPFAESEEECDFYLQAEEDCFENKKSRIDACTYHYHLAQMKEIVDCIKSNTYRPLTSICFVLTYPTYREVFAAKYRDRIVHHIVAPYIQLVTEKVHHVNGDVSHGNIKHHSALTAALQIQERMKAHPDGYVLKMDIQGFFMSISREMAWEIFCKFESIYIKDCDESTRTFYRTLIHDLILSDPTLDCERHSREEEWEHIPKRKSLFGNKGYGLPIGNFYSQLIANLVLAIIDEILHMTHFVDDYCGIYDTIEEVHEAQRLFKELAESIGLTVHPKKVYIQPVRHGVKFCGFVVYKDRMYISNRTVKAALRMIKELPPATIYDVRRLQSSINSYTGIMKHCNSYNIQKQIMQALMNTKYSQYVYFKKENNHLVCQLKAEYKRANISNNQYTNLDNYVNRRMERSASRHA